MSTNKYSHQDTASGLIRSTSVISLGTFGSRILGFIRDMVLAKYLGTGFQADAFFVAFRIPNLFRDMVGEGAMNSSVVPVVAQYAQEKDQKQFWSFISVIFVLAFMILSVLTFFGVVFAPVIVRMIAPGFTVDPQKISLTVDLTRIMFPYLILIGLTAYGMGILYNFRSFAVPAFSPCLLNIAMIGSILFAVGAKEKIVFYLALGVLGGGFLQLAAQTVCLFKKGARFYLPKTLHHPGAKQIGQLLLPRLLGSVVYQLTVFVDTLCASLAFVVGAGGISAIYYANRILQFPMGLFGVALASAILPTLSAFSARQEMSQFKQTVIFALRNISFVMFPISIFLMIFSNEIVQILFERGEFGSYSTAITASALCFYSLGLFCFAASKILVTSFHALQDTKTPVKIAFLCLLINLVLNLLFMVPLKIAGIALASSISSLVNFIILLTMLNKRLKDLTSELKQYFFKILLASLLMGMIAFLTWNQISDVPRVIRLLTTVLMSTVSFFFFCFSLRIQQAQDFYQWILKRF